MGGVKYESSIARPTTHSEIAPPRPMGRHDSRKVAKQHHRRGSALQVSPLLLDIGVRVSRDRQWLIAHQSDLRSISQTPNWFDHTTLCARRVFRSPGVFGLTEEEATMRSSMHPFKMMTFALVVLLAGCHRNGHDTLGGSG